MWCRSSASLSLSTAYSYSLSRPSALERAWPCSGCGVDSRSAGERRTSVEQLRVVVEDLRCLVARRVQPRLHEEHVANLHRLEKHVERDRRLPPLAASRLGGVAARRGMLRVAAAMRKSDLQLLKVLFRGELPSVGGGASRRRSLDTINGLGNGHADLTAHGEEIVALRQRVEEINTTLSTKLDMIMSALQSKDPMRLQAV